MTLLKRVFDHRADLLAALVYGCLAYLSFNALADYANAHHLFPEPWGGYAFAVAVDGSVLYAFISFKRAPWLAGALLVSGAAATYTLQRWHAEGRPHPLVVAGVVPGAMVLVTFAWHSIREAEDRPSWDPLPPPPLVDPDPESEEEPDEEATPDQPRTRTRTNGAAFTADQRQLIAQRVAEGAAAKAIQRELGVSDRAYRDHLLPLVRSLKGDMVRSRDGGS